MRQAQIADLIRRHEGNPLVWIPAMYGGNAYMTANQERDFALSIAQSSQYDRLQTANALRYTYNENVMKANAYHASGYAQPEMLRKIEAGLRIMERIIYYLECDSILDEYQRSGIVI